MENFSTAARQRNADEIFFLKTSITIRELLFGGATLILGQINALRGS